MNDKYTAQARTQEEATIQGLNALGITKEEAIITVEEPGKKGFLGIGQKDAIVIVERKEKIDLVDEFLANEFSRTEPEITSTTETTKEEIVEPKVESQKEKAKEEEKSMTTEEMTEGRNPADVEVIGKNEPTTVSEKKESKKAESEKDDEMAIESVRVYLKEIIIAMDVSDVEVYTSRVDNKIKYDIETKNAGMIIGRHGKVLNGLQTLAQNHMHQLADSKLYVRVDAEKYRERRRTTVETLAERTADKALKTNKPVKLNPMPAHERKQIHRYLNTNPNIKTHSEGREPKRYLVVTPE